VSWARFTDSRTAGFTEQPKWTAGALHDEIGDAVRWVTFERHGLSRAGMIDANGQIVDLRTAIESSGYGEPLPSTVLEMCGAPEALRHAVVRIAQGAPIEARLPLDGVRLRAPIERPGKLICLAGNYREHIVESGFEAVGPHDVITPQMFLKPSTCITADGADISLTAKNVKVGWEVELAVVIGPGGRHIPEARALDHVFGYMVLNDISERSLNAFSRRRERERDQFFDWLAGKWFDGFAPCGPWIVERNDLPDPHSLELRLTVNGEIRQSGNTSEMLIRIPQLVSAASSIMTLEAGDLIATGTPAGAGTGIGQAYLQDGDEVVCEITGIGTLRNRVTAGDSGRRRNITAGELSKGMEP
jgi:2-keto-4-pentenoate hydratase/2-oxohepta-3-ene-1,7-dioic acid hydratase in catechol pathway